MEYLTKDFEKEIVEWLKSDDENATNLAYLLSKIAERKALNMRIVMQQRELLIAFFESVDAEDIEQQRNGKGWKVVDRYLKAIYSA